MRKLSLLCILLIVLGSVVQAETTHYILVGYSGFATKRNGQGQPSGAHDNLVTNHSKILDTYKFVHSSTKSERDDVLEHFLCQDGKSANPELGLIIVANSWGSGHAYKLAKEFCKKCGKKVSYFYMVDGIKKPIGSFSKVIPAQSCINYYQTNGMIHGKALKGCENIDYTDQCSSRDLKSLECHISVEWWGTASARKDLLKKLDE